MAGRDAAFAGRRVTVDLISDMDAVRAAYDEVYAYALGRPGFLVQHVADASTVQTADHASKPVGVVFGLAGLYLRVEKQFSGRQVQESHRVLARRKREWPSVDLPEFRGSVTVLDVLAAPAGAERDAAIEDWCRSVWGAFEHNRPMIVALLREYRIS